MGLAASPLDEAGRRAVGGVWAFRAQLEESAIERFSRLGRQLQDVGAHGEVLTLAQRAVDDERRHTTLCIETAGLFGVAPVGAAPRSAGEIAPVKLAAVERVLYEVVAFCCLTETINAALMTESYRLAASGPVREAVRLILQDEVWHARLGWAHLSTMQNHDRGQMLGELLPRMLRGTVHEELFLPVTPDEGGSEALIRHGELPREARLRVFEGALRDVIFPGLDGLGVETARGRRWLDESLAKGGWLASSGADAPAPS